MNARENESQEAKERRLRKHREWLAKNKDKVRGYAKKRWAAIVASPAEHAAFKKRQSEYAKKNRTKIATYDKGRPPEKRRARALIRGKIYSGLLNRGNCVVCGEAGADGHHEDYAKPREIVWLCKQHHAAVHAGAITVDPKWIVFVAPVKQDSSKHHRGPMPNWKPRTHCKRGHDMTPENTIKSSNRRRGGVCRECQRIHNRAYAARKKQAAIAARAGK